MELNFIYDNNKYVSEFEVSSDFNLHIERAEGGALYIQQRTGNGQYDTVKDAVFKFGDSVIDYDFQALVYPKSIKIVSDINPIAYVATDGEVTEIKSQSKDVEITANGKVDVAPDAGYAYLSKVSVNVNVPQSGGSNIEYLDISNTSGALRAGLVQNALYIRATIPDYGAEMVGSSAYFVTSMLEGVIENTSAVVIDFSHKICMKMSGSIQELTILQQILQNHVTQEEIDAIPRITEEEFYTL